MLELSSIGNPATARHDAMETIVGLGPSTVIHDQRIFNSETRLIADLGVTDWLEVATIVPFRVFATSIRYLDQGGQQVQIENPFLHHRNETLSGIADPWLLGRAATVFDGVTFGVRAGTTMPLGRTVEDPFTLGDAGLAHEHTQFGSGTFEPVIGADASRTFRGVHVDAFALTVQSLYANGHGYQPGDRYAGGAGAASAFGLAHWRFRATIEAQHETAEMWHGTVRTDEGNIGRTDVLAGVEATWRVTDAWHLSATAKFPAYTHVEGGELDQPFFIGLSVGTEFHVFDDTDHAAAVHTVPGDWSGLDKQDLTDDGSAVPLVPVPGKITVFDFWATWCKPCGVVDHELAEVVRRHPDDVAVRKVNVVDTDSPASEKYLGAATLPHLKVFGRDGKLLWEHSSPPLVLTSEVENLIAGAARPVAVAGAKRIAIEVTDAGYVPARIEIEHGVPVTLVLTRTSDKTCATDVHFVMPDGARIDELLPLGQRVEIPLLAKEPGEIAYSCGMNMMRGTIVVK